jgi:hypothetical protein
MRLLLLRLSAPGYLYKVHNRASTLQLVVVAEIMEENTESEYMSNWSPLNAYVRSLNAVFEVYALSAPPHQILRMFDLWAC